MEVDLNIQNKFTKDEVELFTILKEVGDRYTPSTEIYLVGGFVRDLLIGKPSSDIDVMLSNISGEDFAKLVTKHMNIKDAHTIQSNPEKSKFITTSKAYLPLSSGTVQEVDFAQARSEVYREDSRIPDIKTATPREDALRRDLTINSLFYNLKTNQIEDFTGKGIKDLISNTIRTPVDPIKTFSDDPLRIFRVIRFAAKYNGNIDPETYKAMSNPQLKEEIKRKISKERIGVEFIKMIKNPNSQVAIDLLKNTGLLNDIISEALKGTPYEGKLAELEMNQENPNHKLNLWEHTMSVVKNILEQYQDAEPEKRVAMILAALMHDIGKLYQEVWAESKSHPGHRSYHGHEDESAKIIEHIFRYLKIEPYIQQVSLLAKEHMRPHQLSRDKGGAKALRKFIRECGEQSLNWLDVFNLSTADAYAKDVIKDPKTVEEYQTLKSKLEEALATMKVQDESTKVKPVIDGNQIMEALGTKGGPHMKIVIEYLKELMDSTPDLTPEQALQYMAEIKTKSNEYMTLNKGVTYEQAVMAVVGQISGSGADKEVLAGVKDASTCPQHLFHKKFIDIYSLLDENKELEAISNLKKLKEEYGNDERVVRLVAISMLKILSKKPELRDNNIIQYAFDKAERSFYDAVLSSYVLGLLILLKTGTKQEDILDMGLKTSNMSPGILRTVLDSLPEEVYHKEVKQKLKAHLELV